MLDKLNEWFDRLREIWNNEKFRKYLRRTLSVATSVFKVAAGALITVVLIGVVCAFVFLGVLGDYLQEDVLP